MNGGENLHPMIQLKKDPDKFRANLHLCPELLSELAMTSLASALAGDLSINKPVADWFKCLVIVTEIEQVPIILY